jgi:hypothetical protein
MRIYVDVTQQDIDAGIPTDCELCPVAIATIRALEQALGYKPSYFAVTDEEVFIELPPAMGYNPLALDTPQEAHDFIDAFDSAYSADLGTPFKFYLDLPL